jgi:hypothetical protein
LCGSSGIIATSRRFRLTDGDNKNYIELVNQNGGTLNAICYNPSGSELRKTTLMDGNGNTEFPGQVTIGNKLTVKTGTVDMMSSYVIAGDMNTRYCYFRPDGQSTRKNLLLYVTPGGALNIRDDNVSPAKFYTLYYGSQTVTHKTNVVGELGTFCESTGDIYDGYEHISHTDCICNVRTSTSLNKRIVGIICSEDEFASHGDVYVRVNDINGLEVGDILCPDENGYGKKADEAELMLMVLHAIPRPKITSLDTAFEGYIACFLV